MLRRLAALVALAWLSLSACSERVAQKEPADRPTTGPLAGWTVSERGIGPLRAGMTLAEGAAAVGSGFGVPEGGDTTTCGYVNWPTAPAGVWVMTERGRVVRVEVREGTTATSAGVRVGDPEGRVDSLYRGRLAVTPAKYDAAGHYLTVTPASPADSAYRLIFETDGRVVTRYRAGIEPQVGYVEGCG